jgi:hypothetical protein
MRVDRVPSGNDTIRLEKLFRAPAEIGERYRNVQEGITTRLTYYIAAWRLTRTIGASVWM